MEEYVFFYFIDGKKEAQRMLCFPSGAGETELDPQGSALTLNHPPRKEKNIQETEGLGSREVGKLLRPHCWVLRCRNNASHSLPFNMTHTTSAWCLAMKDKCLACFQRACSWNAYSDLHVPGKRSRGPAVATFSISGGCTALRTDFKLFHGDTVLLMLLKLLLI